ncbi:MAG: peptidylprolyl isomerase [Firmicutes bacterium]|nr:peptidylprolyl isomerase [Bacillota bacterium]
MAKKLSSKAGASLTAKERKELSRAKSNKDYVQINAAQSTETPAEGEIAGAISLGGEKVFTQKKKLILLVSIALSIILIVMAVLLPIVFSPMYRYRNINNPVAVMELSNGDVIELEIFERQLPYTASNFIYLARKGFFDGTIIFDTTVGAMRFGQYESYSTYRSRNETFLQRITDITVPGTAHNNNKFDYRLNQENMGHGSPFQYHDREFGRISLAVHHSGTEFQITGKRPNVASLDAPIKDTSRNVTPLNMAGQAFGRLLNPQSEAVVEKIVNMPQFENDHPFWSGPNPTITIKRVRLHNLDLRGKWRNFNWDEFFQPAGQSAKIYWAGGAGGGVLV